MGRGSIKQLLTTGLARRQPKRETVESTADDILYGRSQRTSAPEVLVESLEPLRLEIGTKVIINIPGAIYYHGKSGRVSDISDGVERLYQVKIEHRKLYRESKDGLRAYQLVPSASGLRPRGRVNTPDGVGIFLRIQANEEGEVSYEVALEQSLTSGMYYEDAHQYAQPYSLDQIEPLAAEET